MNTEITNKKAKIISNKKIKDTYFEIIIKAPKIAQSAQPGQFVNIKVNGATEPLLRRPLSIHRVGAQGTGDRGQLKTKNNIVMLYETVGKGTEILSQRKPGEFLDVIGPLGKGFDYEGREQKDDRRVLLVAGGMGTAPLVFLAERLAYSVERRAHSKNKRPKSFVKVLIGAKTKDHILCEKEFRELGCEVKIATDDGSRGFEGYVSELLTKELSAIRWPSRRRRGHSPSRYPLSAIYACGPKLLLKEISRIAQEHTIPAQLSLESHMACGIGACMGCVIKTKDERRGTRDAYRYKRVCKEGPVFEANQILWE